jgi:SAM-dependent methyltransferase
MNDELLRFYRARIAEFGLGYRAMWGDAAGWKSRARFHPLSLLPIEPGDVVVDIGCGLADLANFFREHSLDISYIGIEAVPEFAAEARAATGCEIVELDAFRNLDLLPAADWYVTFGTLNKSWSIADLPGNGDADRLHTLLERLWTKARKGVAASFVTDVVEYKKEGVVNLDPALTAARLKALTPHFMVFHGYSFYEYFAAAWRGQRR